MFDRLMPTIGRTARRMRIAAKREGAGSADTTRSARKLDAARTIRWLKVGLRLRPLISRADALRDSGRHGEAAAAYEAALEVAPWHTGLKIQCGNMLKDIGRVDEALRWYQAALLERPDDAEIHLQTGHALKLVGRRTHALASYRQVLHLDPQNRHASWELIQAGEIDEQGRGMIVQMTGHGLETMLALSAEVETMRRRLSDMAAELPDIASVTAFPRTAYSLFRQIYDVPPPPPAGSAVAISDLLVVADAAGLDATGLHRLIASILAQSSGRWQALLTGVDPDLEVVVDRLARADPRFELAKPGPFGRSDTLRLACESPSSTILFVAKGASLHRHCVAWFVATFADVGADLLTCDEEWRHPGERDVSGFEARGGFDLEMLLQENSWGETIAVQRTVLTALDLASSNSHFGNSDAAFATSDLLLSAARLGASIGHVPFPLVASEADEGERERASRAARPGHRLAVERHLQILGLENQAQICGGTPDEALRLRWLPDAPSAAITVIIPTRDNGADCEAFVASLFELADRSEAVDCLIIDNGTQKEADLDRLKRLGGHPRVRIRRDDGPFNWSHINNLGAHETDADILVFANDDMEMLSKGWDATLRGLLAREAVGVVGAKLLYPDDTVQHAGVLFGWKGSVIHDGLYEPTDAGGPSNRWLKTRSVSAVTGAFLAMRRTDFAALGGFDALQLPIGYSDIDLCLKMRATGRSVVFTPDVTLHHHESKSRGLDHLDKERIARSRDERRVIENRWGSMVFSRDPSLNPIWVDATLPFRLICFPSPQRALEFARLIAKVDAATKSAAVAGSCEYPVYV